MKNYEDFSEVIFKMDKWMPDDENLMDEYYEILDAKDMDFNDKVLAIEELIINSADEERLMNMLDDIDANMKNPIRELSKAIVTKYYTDNDMRGITESKKNSRKTPVFESFESFVAINERFGDLWNAKGKVFRVGTPVAKMLFDNEIAGQLSDGHWENSRPHDHWIPWGTCTVEVGSPVGREFPVPRDTYNLISKDLVKVVGGRMFAASRYMVANKLSELSREDYNIIEDIYNPWNYTDEPNSIIEVTKKYEIPFDEFISSITKSANPKVTAFIKSNRDALQKAHEYSAYKWKHVSEELKQIALAMKTPIR